MIDEIKLSSINRFEEKLPPGFKDGNKQTNSIGDLVIWREILDYCKLKKINKAILLSNDNKTDWMYKPNSILRGEKKITNEDFRIVDPRLVHEFNLNTGSEEFYIINFETLTQILIKRGQDSFKSLAMALQIVHKQEEEKKIISNSDEELEKFSSHYNIEKPLNEILINNDDNSDNEYSKTAIQNSDFQIDYDDPIDQIIDKLTTSDWYGQNDAISLINPTIFSKLNLNQRNKDKLFVLGRSIYQSACGGAFSAMTFLDELKAKLRLYLLPISTHLLNGMFFEIYFDSKGLFRENRLKTVFYEQLFNLQTESDYKEVITFINNKLELFKNNLVILPSQTPKNVTINVFFETKSESFEWGDIIYNKITDITYCDKSLLIEATNRIDIFKLHNNIINNLKKELGYHFAIPLSQIQLTFEPNLEENIDFGFMLPDSKILGIDI